MMLEDNIIILGFFDTITHKWIYILLYCSACEVLSASMVQAIAKDTTLSRCKIIAEPWDCGGLYLVGKFPNWDR